MLDKEVIEKKTERKNKSFGKKAGFYLLIMSKITVSMQLLFFYLIHQFVNFEI